MNAEQVAEVLRTRLIADFVGRVSVDALCVADYIGVGFEEDVRIVALRGPYHRLWACAARHPDWRVRSLKRAHEWVHHAELVVLAFPAKWAGCRPCLDDEVVSFLKAVAVVDRVGVRCPGLHAGAPHEAGYEPAFRDKVDLGKLLRHSYGVFLYGEGIAEQHDLRLLGCAG